MDVASAELLKHGILGVLLFFAGIAIWKLWSDRKDAGERHEAALKKINDDNTAALKKTNDDNTAALKALNDTHAAALKSLNDMHIAALKTTGDQRVSDQQSMQTQLLRITTECVEVLTTVANGMEAQQRAMAELSEAFVSSQSVPGPRPRR